MSPRGSLKWTVNWVVIHDKSTQIRLSAMKRVKFKAFCNETDRTCVNLYELQLYY